jgi:hypothetical protein
MVLILNQIDSVHNLVSYFFNIYFNVSSPTHTYFSQVVSHLDIDKLKFCMCFSSLLYMLITSLIPFICFN